MKEPLRTIKDCNEFDWFIFVFVDPVERRHTEAENEETDSKGNVRDWVRKWNMTLSSIHAAEPG